MIRHVSFSKIPQFRSVVRNVRHQSSFAEVDSDGEPIYNKNVVMPTVTFRGTVKLHGSNGAVCLSNDGETWCQSRKKILYIDSDNSGFWQFCHDRRESFANLFPRTDTNPSIIIIFGEYCGQGINAGCAIHKLPKMFVIFAVKVVPEDGESYYIDSDGLRDTDNQIFNIMDFERYSVAVNFAHPELAQNKFVELVENVEAECPVGKAFGVSGIGEGIVWVGEYDGIRHVFKTKGEKHSVSKVKKIASVNIEKINSIRDFVEYAVTENRLNQGIREVFEEKEPDIKGMGDFLRWVMNDISAEEADTLGKNGLILKDVGRAVSNIARPWFQALLDGRMGL